MEWIWLTLSDLYSYHGRHIVIIKQMESRKKKSRQDRITGLPGGLFHASFSFAEKSKEALSMCSMNNQEKVRREINDLVRKAKAGSREASEQLLSDSSH